MKCKSCGNEVEIVMCAVCRANAEETSLHEPLTNAEVNKADDRKEFKFNTLAQYLAIALLLLGIFAVYQTNRVGYLGERTDRQSLSIEDFETELLNVYTQIDELETECENLRSINTSLQDKNDSSLGQLRTIEDTLNEYRSKSDFLDEHITLVTLTGEKYHKYNCQYVRNTKYYAYNIELAKSKDYEPCSVCYDE